MTTWYHITRRTINENTSEYGFGDYPKTYFVIDHAVEADTKRKAQNAIKKLDKRAMFSGQFGDICETLDPEMQGDWIGTLKNLMETREIN